MAGQQKSASFCFPKHTDAVRSCAGFFLSYNSSHLAPNITEAVGNLMQRHPGKPLYVAGHSMGGALATLCAIDLKFAFGIPDVRVYTYGSPRVGNDIFARFFAANIQVLTATLTATL